MDNNIRQRNRNFLILMKPIFFNKENTEGWLLAMDNYSTFGFALSPDLYIIPFLAPMPTSDAASQANFQ